MKLVLAMAALLTSTTLLVPTVAADTGSNHAVHAARA
jgi:hypothetical protein